MSIDQSEFDAWLKNNVTQRVFKVIGERRENILKSIVYDNSDMFEDSNCKKILFKKGILSAYDGILNIKYDDSITEETEDE